MEALRAVHDAFDLDKEPELMEEIAPTQKKQDAISLLNRIHGMEDLFINKIELDKAQARITIANVPDRAGLSCMLFDSIAKEGVVVDMIVQSQAKDARAKISFTVPKDEFDVAMKVAEHAIPEAVVESACKNIAKVSVFGTGMKSHTNVAARVMKTLADAKINLGMINTSEATFNVTVPAEDGERAFDLLKKEFVNEMV